MDCMGAGPLAKLLGVSEGTVYDYCKDPEDPFVNKKAAGDPLQTFHRAFKAADIRGSGIYVDAAIAYLKTAKVDRGEELLPIKKPLPTRNEEMLADYPAMYEYHESIKRNDPVEVVEKFEALLIAELKRTTIRHRKSLEAGK